MVVEWGDKGDNSKKERCTRSMCSNSNVDNRTVMKA